MKAISTFFLALCLIPYSLMAAPSKTAESRSAQCIEKGKFFDSEKNVCRIKTFSEWCNSPENDEDTELTVSRVLNALNVSDCDEALNALKKKPILNLSHPGLKIVDLRPLASLTMLQELYLIGHRISDVSPLRRLQSLKKLSVRHNQISNVVPLAELKNLEILDISGNFVTHYGSLAPLPNLKRLRVDRLDEKFKAKSSAQLVIATP